MQMFQIPLNEKLFLFTMPAPKLLEDGSFDLQTLTKNKVHCVISLLSESDALHLGLIDEKNLLKALHIDFIHFPINDFGTAEKEDDFIALAKLLHKKIEDQQILAIHCWAGIGRSSLLAGAILILMGMDSNEVFSHISKYRKQEVPDKQSQALWLQNLAPKLLRK
jgi:protein-tyrosine phosphatase